MIPKTTDSEQPVTFNNPHKFEKVPGKDSTKQHINYKKSEICVLLEALGTPRVFYAGRQNKYFKDADFTNLFTDEEVQKLGLPIPAELEDQRRKLQKKVLDGGLDMTYDDIIKKTMPTVLEPPDHIKAKLANLDPTERAIRRINRSTLGK